MLWGELRKIVCAPPASGSASASEAPAQLRASRLLLTPPVAAAVMASASESKSTVDDATASLATAGDDGPPALEGAKNVAAVLHAVHDLRVEEYAMPEEPGKGDVWVAIKRVGICGRWVHDRLGPWLPAHLRRWPVTKWAHDAAGARMPLSYQ